MHSVVLTELGVSIFNEDRLEKAFPFSNPVRDYLEIKNKEARLDKLVNFLSSLQRGVVTNDSALVSILKKNSIDIQLMNEEELEEIQSSKPQIIVNSGFAENISDALGKLREFALGLSSSKVTTISESPDLHIIQAINSLDEVDKIANALSSRLREWYGLHFPELENIIDSINGYAQIVMAGKRDVLTKKVFEDAGFPDSKVEMLSLIASKSRGGDISEKNLKIVQSMAKQMLELHDLRKNLEEHVDSEMEIVAPNLSAILGAAVGARILGRAGSLTKLASMPASTIQVIGAEKALFRSLKTGAQPPKHGILFQHTMVHAAPRWQRGKIARAIAAKAVIAARVDVYGEGINETLLEKLNVRVKEIGKKYEVPTERETRDSNFSRPDRREFDRRGGGFSRRERDPRKRDSRDDSWRKDSRPQRDSRDDSWRKDSRPQRDSRDDSWRKDSRPQRDSRDSNKNKKRKKFGRR